MELSEDEMAFVEYANASQAPAEGNPISKLKSYFNAPVKGFIKGVRDVEEIRNLPRKALGLPTELGLTSIPQDRFNISQQENFPTQNNLLSRILERSGEFVPGAILGGGGKGAGIVKSLFQSLIPGTAGQAAEELGVGEIGQTIAEIGSLGLPSLAKKIVPKTAQKATLKGARALGMSEKEIAPLLAEDGWLTRQLQKISHKRPAQGRLKQSQEALGKVMSNLRTRPEAVKPLSKGVSKTIRGEIQTVLDQLPNSIAKPIKDDLKKFLSKDMSGQSLVDLYRAAGRAMGKNAPKELVMIKNVILKNTPKVGKQFAEDFALSNKLYSRYANISKKLNPSIADDLFSLGETGEVLHGLITGNPNLIIGGASIAAGRQLATEMLTNPRFVNLSKQITSALNKNKVNVANRLIQQYAKSINKTDPDLSLKLRDFELPENFGKD